MSQKKSGAEFRKERLKREEEKKKLADNWQKWFHQNKTNTPSSSIASTSALSEISAPSAQSAPSVMFSMKDSQLSGEKQLPKNSQHMLEVTERVISDSQLPDVNQEDQHKDEIIITEAETTLDNADMQGAAKSAEKIDFCDPATWPTAFSQQFIRILVEHGPKHDMDASYLDSANEDGRHFSSSWFFKILPNGEKIIREWLLYSRPKKSVFCFPCMIFGAKKNSSSLTDPSRGFSKWKKLNPIIPSHENNIDHRTACITWKNFQKQLKLGQVIDSALESTIQKAKNKWRLVVRVVIDVILYCAGNNLALRGSSNVVGNSDAGIFLNTLELIGKYNTEIGAHILNIKQAETKRISYFSWQIQNEVINLVGSEIRTKIKKEIHRAKYYSISFDCTPDVSHKEQMTQIMRYVKISEDGKCSIEERFIDFIESKAKTGLGLGVEVLSKIENDGFDIKNCRAQCYDNGANMAGKYKGVQARILEENEFAIFVPCSAHSINLVGVHAASVSPRMTTFFGIVQNLFVFFSGSTNRWDILMKHIKISLKPNSNTRWSAKKHAVNSLLIGLPNVLTALKEIVQENRNPASVSGAQNYIKQINYEFICGLTLWNAILELIDRVNISLQRKDIDIACGSKLLRGLRDHVNQLKNSLEQIYEKASGVCDSLSLVSEMKEKRKRKIKKMVSEQAEDEGSNMCEKEKFKYNCIEVLDLITTQLDWRFQKLTKLSDKFEFLSGQSITSMTTEDLEKRSFDLARKYHCDLDAAELILEVASAKHMLQSFDENFCKLSHLQILQTLHDFGLVGSYPNMEIAYRIFLSIPVTSATCERSFSKLKLVKNYLRSSMSQERLTNLAIISIEILLAKALDYEGLIDQFAQLKARKVKF